MLYFKALFWDSPQVSLLMGFRMWCSSFLISCMLIWIAAVTVLGRCGTPKDTIEELSLNGHWRSIGLERTNVTVLQGDGDGLLVGTDQGLYRWSKDGLERVGLEEYEIRGVVRLKGNGLLVGVMGDGSYHQTVFFESLDDGESWNPVVNNFGGEEGLSFVYRLESASRFSDTLFAAGCGAARSTNGGETWEPLSGSWECFAGLPALLYVDYFYPGRIWFGGVTGISQAYLWKATDYGSIRENVTAGLSDQVEAVAYDVMTHPENSEWVLVGLGGTIAKANSIKKSKDGGESWHVALGEIGAHAFAHSIRYPRVVYASGRDASTRPFFVATADFGETWQKQTFEEGPVFVTINDLAVIIVDSRENLILGTDRGLFSFRFE